MPNGDQDLVPGSDLEFILETFGGLAEGGLSTQAFQIPGGRPGGGIIPADQTTDFTGFPTGVPAGPGIRPAIPPGVPLSLVTSTPGFGGAAIPIPRDIPPGITIGDLLKKTGRLRGVTLPGAISILLEKIIREATKKRQGSVINPQLERIRKDVEIARRDSERIARERQRAGERPARPLPQIPRRRRRRIRPPDPRRRRPPRRRPPRRPAPTPPIPIELPDRTPQIPGQPARTPTQPQAPRQPEPRFPDDEGGGGPLVEDEIRPRIGQFPPDPQDGPFEPSLEPPGRSPQPQRPQPTQQPRPGAQPGTRPLRRAIPSLLPSFRLGSQAGPTSLTTQRTLTEQQIGVLPFAEPALQRDPCADQARRRRRERRERCQQFETIEVPAHTKRICVDPEATARRRLRGVESQARQAVRRLF